jgi:phosphopentomutase
MVYGHRNNIAGYAKAMSDFDKSLGEMLKLLREDDLLIITADHGCDPADDSTDHTREYVPLVIFGEKVKPTPLGTLSGFGTVAKLVTDLLGVEYSPESGESVSELIAKDL